MKGTTRSRSGGSRLGLFDSSLLCGWGACHCRCRFGACGSDALCLAREGFLAHLDPVVLLFDLLYKVLYVSGPKKPHNHISNIQ